MKKVKSRATRTVSEASVTFPHLVPAGMLDTYLRKTLPWHAAIKTVKVSFAVLEDAEYDALYDACREECFPSRHPSAIKPNPWKLDEDLLAVKGDRTALGFDDTKGGEE